MEMTKQIEELRHRVGTEVIHLSKVNAETVYYLDRDGNLSEVFGGIKNYRDRLFRALGSNDHNKRLFHGKTLMKDLWEVEIGLGPYPFSEVLAEFEFGGQFWDGYRDHVLHQLRVYILGLYIFFGCKRIRGLFQRTHKLSDFLIQWKIAALSHDHGYLFEPAVAETNQWVIDKVMPVFDACMGFPLSSLSETIRKRSFSAAGDENTARILEAVIKRSITRSREEQIQGFFEIVRPAVRTVGQLRSFRNRDLFECLKDTADRVFLSRPDTNALESYYEFTSKHSPWKNTPPARDHGITSALFLLLQSEFLTYYYKKLGEAPAKTWKQLGLPDENIAFITGVCELNRRYQAMFRKAAGAVALHNISAARWSHSQTYVSIAENDYGLTLPDFRISPRTNPLAFLLVLVDTLQDWDRPSFVQIPDDGLPMYQADQDLSITLDDDHIYLSFPTNDPPSFEPYAALIGELHSKFEIDFVDDLVRRTDWNAVGVCHLTKEAQQIERPGVLEAGFLGTKQLKELIVLAEEHDHFTYSLYLDTRKEAHVLRLIRDLVALSNTDGGYFVVGIDEAKRVPRGIGSKTFIHDEDHLNEIINLFCSKHFDYLGQKKKFLIETVTTKSYEFFYVFYVPKNQNLLYLTRDGRFGDRGQAVFEKYDIPIRLNSATIFADHEHLQKFVEPSRRDGVMFALSNRVFTTNGGPPTNQSIRQVPGDLPSPDFDRLIGREEEIEEIVNFLKGRKVFTWTIKGIGGCGKSALALQIAQNIRDVEYSRPASCADLEGKFDGIVWVTAKSCELHAEKGIVPRFDAAVSVDVLLHRISDVIGLTELKDVDFEERKSTILEFLEEFCLLIFIDNLETIPESHLAEIITFVDEIPPPSKVIYTTRTKFHSGYSSQVMELGHEDAILLAKTIALNHGNYSLMQDNDLIKRVVARTGRVPLGIKWVMSRLCGGNARLRPIEELLDDKTLVKFCFEETLKVLEESDEVTLFAVAMCDFTPNIGNIEFVTGLPKGALEQSLERLESLSLIWLQGDELSMLPLTRDYAMYQLQRKEVLASKLRKNLEQLCQVFPVGTSDAIPAAEIMALRLYKEAGFKESQDDLAGACSNLEQALSLAEEEYILIGLAGVYERQGRTEDQRKLYEKYLEKFGDEFEILKKMSIYCYREHDNVGALRYIRRALRLRPGDKNLWHHRGRRERYLARECGSGSQRGLQYCNSAITSFRNAIRQGPDTNLHIYYNSVNYLNLVKCYLWKNERRKALEACTAGLEEDPNNRVLLSWLSRIGVNV